MALSTSTASLSRHFLDILDIMFSLPASQLDSTKLVAILTFMKSCADQSQPPGPVTNPQYTTDFIYTATKLDASDNCWFAIPVADNCKPHGVAGPLT
jgi:hypothetical protein